MFKNKELPQEYKDSLNGFKMQAGFALESINGDTKDRSELHSAHELMSKSAIARRHVYQILMEEDTNIDEINEEKLFDFLSIKYPLVLTHLKDVPFFYAVCNKINDIEYYFITQYFNDGLSWGGHDVSVNGTLEIMNKSLHSNEKFIKLNTCPEELLKTLKEPSFASDFYILEKAN